MKSPRSGLAGLLAHATTSVRRRTWATGAAMMAIALGACSGNGVGFTARGTLTATTGTASAPTRYGITLRGERIDPALTSGTAGGVVGTCTVGPLGRELRLETLGGPSDQLRAMRITLNDWADDSCTNCLHGTAQVTVGSTVFSAEDRRAPGTSGTCVLTATRPAAYAMTVEARCEGLRADGDARTFSLEGSMALEGCDGPASGGPTR